MSFTMVDHSSSENKKTKNNNLSPRNNTTINSIGFFFYKFSQLLIILLFQIFVLQYIIRPPPKSVVPYSSLSQDHVPQKTNSNLQQLPQSKTCPYGKVYVYNLPQIFNQDLLKNCRDLDPWNSRCKAISNHGLGPKATGLSNVPENLIPAWYWTDMFAGEVLYHHRILNHRCRTLEPESATAYYIPFYAGLAVGKYLFTNYTAQDRDMHCKKLLRWIGGQPTWRRSNGSDHFIMLGRMTWDFRRSRDDDWGSSFIHMPAMKRVLRLAVERDPWDQQEISVPYPTGFHPRSKPELNQWLDFVKTRKRESLFTFVGGKRKVDGDFRAVLQNHCANESDTCRVVDCSGTRCYDGTSEIMAAFLAADFCLQPRGDAYTRRSTFDCMLAGSIPVFFWKRSVYDQYEWFLGDEPGRFSVFIDRRDVRNGTSIRKVLEGFSRERVRRMREKVISLIPRFVYSSFRDGDGGKREDAFDIAVDGVLRRFQEEKRKKSGDKLSWNT